MRCVFFLLMANYNPNDISLLSIWILDNCSQNKVQSFCEGLPRCKGEVRIHTQKLMSSRCGKIDHQSFYFCRSEDKDIKEDVNDNQQSTYSQCKYYTKNDSFFILSTLGTTCGSHMFPSCLPFFCGASRWLVYSRRRLPLPSC